MTKIALQTAEKEEVSKKNSHRVTNWSFYNKALVNRRDITI